jgi:hypothetical protein
MKITILILLKQHTIWNERSIPEFLVKIEWAILLLPLTLVAPFYSNTGEDAPTSWSSDLHPLVSDLSSLSSDLCHPPPPLVPGQTLDLGGFEVPSQPPPLPLASQIAVLMVGDCRGHVHGSPSLVPTRRVATLDSRPNTSPRDFGLRSSRCIFT